MGQAPEKRLAAKHGPIQPDIWPQRSFVSVSERLLPGLSLATTGVEALALFHSGTQTLIDRWAALPRVGGVPLRADFEPMRFGRLVPRLFSADRTSDGAILRLAGGWVETLHGRQMTGVPWLDLWTFESRPMVQAAIVQTVREARPVVVVAEAARLNGALEIVIAPLRTHDGLADRLLGLYQPAFEQERRREAVGPLTARLSVGVGISSRPALTLAAVDGRRIA
jgi:hypothetical protein